MRQELNHLKEALETNSKYMNAIAWSFVEDLHSIERAILFTDLYDALHPESIGFYSTLEEPLVIDEEKVLDKVSYEWKNYWGTEVGTNLRMTNAIRGR